MGRYSAGVILGSLLYSSHDIKCIFNVLSVPKGAQVIFAEFGQQSVTAVKKRAKVVLLVENCLESLVEFYGFVDATTHVKSQLLKTLESFQDPTLVCLECQLYLPTVPKRVLVLGTGSLKGPFDF